MRNAGQMWFSALPAFFRSPSFVEALAGGDSPEDGNREPANRCSCVCKRAAGRVCDVFQPLPYGGREVHGPGVCHRRAPRYGATTRSTRHTWENFSISAGFARPRSRASRSASTATSIPTVFRNLKQSATVLAAE